MVWVDFVLICWWLWYVLGISLGATMGQTWLQTSINKLTYVWVRVFVISKRVFNDVDIFLDISVGAAMGQSWLQTSIKKLITFWMVWVDFVLFFQWFWYVLGIMLGATMVQTWLQTPMNKMIDFWMSFGWWPVDVSMILICFGNRFGSHTGPSMASDID